MNFLTTQSHSGYSMIEVLVAISVLLLATVGPMTIASRSLQHAEFVGQQNTAFFLAQEGVEAAVAVRNEYALEHFDGGSVDPWDWLNDAALTDCRPPNDGCSFDWDNGDMLSAVYDCPAAGCTVYYDSSTNRGRYNHSGGEATPYTRTVTIESLNAQTAIVTAEVQWTAPNQADPQAVILRTYLHDIYDPS